MTVSDWDKSKTDKIKEKTLLEIITGIQFLKYLTVKKNRRAEFMS
jgi:hypothetical protein